MPSTLKIRGVKVTPGQWEVYQCLRDIPAGMPDHALVPYAQHASGLRMSSSGIRSRRAELAASGLVKPAGTVKTGSGRIARVYKAVR